jgi:hypothetical protein
MTSRRVAVSAAALALVLGVGAGCGVSPPPPIVSCDGLTDCPAGWQCSAKTAQCINGKCGNGVVDSGEVCDDGGVTDGDIIDGKTCNSTCTSDETCGNGIKDIREACDCKRDQNGVIVKCDPPWATSCSPDCTATGLCGNGITDPGEDCDDGVNGAWRETATCNVDCTARKCGDGKVNTTALEQCDRNGDGVGDFDGLVGQSPTCNTDCTLSRCGDGKIDPQDKRIAPSGEQCDDGDARNGWNASCLPNCVKNVCGDGHLNKAMGSDGKPIEDCDSGPNDALPRVDCPYSTNLASCQLCSVCKYVAGTPHYCGDNRTDAPNEACDQGSANGASVCPYGTTTCTLCSGDCKTKKAGTGTYCGDGIVNGGTLSNGSYYQEECDNAVSIACGTCSSPTSANPCKNIPAAGGVGCTTGQPCSRSADCISGSCNAKHLCN